MIHPYQHARTRLFALAGTALLLATTVTHGAANISSDSVDIDIRILTLNADPPGRMRLAPGGGRELTPAVLFTPKRGENPYSPAIVMLTEGPNSNPVRRDQPSRFAAERLAAHGYTVVSLYSHFERGYAQYAMEESAYDIKAALDYLEQAGHEKLILSGDSYGAIAVANYLATMKDESSTVEGGKRLKAAVLFAPLTELRAYPNAGLEVDYDAKVNAARASVASGKGLVPKVVEPGNVGSADDDPWMSTGIFVLPAEMFLNYFGPEAQTRNLELFNKLTLPTLVIAGDADKSVSVATLQSWQKAAADRQLIIYPKGDAQFSNLQQQASKDMIAYLDRSGLSVAPAVKVSFASVTSDHGRVLDGVLYTPANGVDPHKPAFIMHHGLSEDVVHSSTHWLGWRLAQAGYAALSISTAATSTAGATTTGKLDVVAGDLGHWVDWMDQHGYKRIVLTGHSLGGILISNYESLTQDKRVIGLVYMAPTADQDAARFEQRLGTPQYQALLKEATDAVTSGKGDTHVMSSIRLQTAAKWLDVAGPNSRGNHTQRISEFSQPILVLAGTADPIMRPEFVNGFVKAHPGKSELIWYPNGTHGMKELKDRVRDDITHWTSKTFGN